eukprot:9639099-Lingulodinium_polyedra.AAC.1
MKGGLRGGGTPNGGGYGGGVGRLYPGGGCDGGSNCGGGPAGRVGHGAATDVAVVGCFCTGAGGFATTDGSRRLFSLVAGLL